MLHLCFSWALLLNNIQDCKSISCVFAQQDAGARTLTGAPVLVVSPADEKKAMITATLSSLWMMYGCKKRLTSQG